VGNGWLGSGRPRALPVAKALVSQPNAQLLVAHCEEMMVVPGKGAGIFPVHADEEELKAKIERQLSELAAGGIHATLHVLRSRAGGAAHALADLAAEEAVELIVVGTRGHTPLGGLLLGSVTQRLLQIAPCPVLVVPARASRKEQPAGERAAAQD
jgi:nucleotide-binding universal stress UspA family protein